MALIDMLVRIQTLIFLSGMYTTQLQLLLIGQYTHVFGLMHHKRVPTVVRSVEASEISVCRIWLHLTRLKLVAIPGEFLDLFPCSIHFDIEQRLKKR